MNSLCRAIANRVAGKIDRAALCSVVPDLTPALSRGLTQRFGVRPRLLTADLDHGLAIGYWRPRELGADRLAAALGARAKFPRQGVIVVDCGTATTITALRGDGMLLGGAIIPGWSLWPKALAAATAQLPLVSPRRPIAALGRSPREGILSGSYFGQAGAIRELVRRVRTEAFGRARALVVGTGGSASLFVREELFDLWEPNLILYGLYAFISAT